MDALIGAFELQGELNNDKTQRLSIRTLPVVSSEDVGQPNVRSVQPGLGSVTGAGH